MKLYEYLARMLRIGIAKPKHILKLFNDSKEGKKVSELLKKKLYDVAEISCMECCKNPTQGYVVLIIITKFKEERAIYCNVNADMELVITTTYHGYEEVDISKHFRNFLLNTSVSGNMYNKLMNAEKKK